MRRGSALVVLIAWVLSSLALEAEAGPHTVPLGLQRGDEYRLAFVTSDVVLATSGDISSYNAFVSGVAEANPELAALDATWTMIGSTATVSARDNTNTNPAIWEGVPIYTTDGLLVAADNADLWDGEIRSSIHAHEDGTRTRFDRATVWTGTDADGSSSVFPLGGVSRVRQGSAVRTEELWIEGLGGQFHRNARKVYGISSVLVAIPEPGTGSLVAAGLLVLSRRRHRA